MLKRTDVPNWDTEYWTKFVPKKYIQLKFPIYCDASKPKDVSKWKTYLDSALG